MNKNLKKIFNETTNEKGNKAYHSTQNRYLDIIMRAPNLNSYVELGKSEFDKAFAMMLRDPRYGLGYKDYGRKYMNIADVSSENVVLAGRADDLLYMGRFKDFAIELEKGNELFKKWAPRSGSKTARFIKELRPLVGGKKRYKELLKNTNATEQKITRREAIDFNKVPGKALFRHSRFFENSPIYQEDFANYRQKLATGESKINTGALTPYDILLKYNRNPEALDIIHSSFNNLARINIGKVLPIVDNSGSMYDSDRSYLKARAIGHYVAKISDYYNNHIVTFSSEPKLLELGSSYDVDMQIMNSFDDITTTDFGKVMELLSNLSQNDRPDYLLVLSDMNFDAGSSQKKDEAMKILNGVKIIWWNFNSAASNSKLPETDQYGNLFLSGYNPALLELLDKDFDGNQYVEQLVRQYVLKINENLNK